MECPPKTAPVSKLVIRWYTDFERMGKNMARKNYTVEQIIVILRKVEVLCGQGMTVKEAVKQEGITENTYFRWRKEYGGMSTAEVKRLKELEKENSRLKKIVAELSLDNEMLKDVASKNF